MTGHQSHGAEATALLESVPDRPREPGASEALRALLKSSVVLSASATPASTRFTEAPPSKACPTISLLSTGGKDFSKQPCRQPSPAHFSTYNYHQVMRLHACLPIKSGDGLTHLRSQCPGTVLYKTDTITYGQGRRGTQNVTHGHTQSRPLKPHTRAPCQTAVSLLLAPPKGYTLAESHMHDAPFWGLPHREVAPSELGSRVQCMLEV